MRSVLEIDAVSACDVIDSDLIGMDPIKIRDTDLRYKYMYLNPKLFLF